MKEKQRMGVTKYAIFDISDDEDRTGLEAIINNSKYSNDKMEDPEYEVLSIKEKWFPYLEPGLPSRIVDSDEGIYSKNCPPGTVMVYIRYRVLSDSEKRPKPLIEKFGADDLFKEEQDERSDSSEAVGSTSVSQ